MFNKIKECLILCNKRGPILFCLAAHIIVVTQVEYEGGMLSYMVKLQGKEESDPIYLNQNIYIF